MQSMQGIVKKPVVVLTLFIFHLVQPTTYARQEIWPQFFEPDAYYDIVSTTQVGLTTKKKEKEDENRTIIR